MAVYFPAGIYRITAPLEIPFAQFFRLFGDGGRGGGFQGTVPMGTIIRQDTDDEPIFVFTRGDIHSWTIERLGFTWKNSQGPPPEPTPGDPRLPARKPGAVGVLFRPEGGSGHCYHGRITECTFTRGWRGVALDDRTQTQGGLGQAIAVWNTQIDHCSFVDMTGAGVRFTNAPGLFVGMPGNTFRSLLVQQVGIENVESQIRVNQQTDAVLEGLDLEGSHSDHVLWVTGRATIRDVHLEHLEIHKPYYRVIFLADGLISLDGLSVDGVLDALDENDNPTFGSIIAVYPPSAVLSGLQGRRGNDQSTGGIALFNGDAYLVKSVAGTQVAEVRLVGRPSFPNRPQDQYKVWLWNDDPSLGVPTANVVAEPAKARVMLSGAAVAPGAALTQTVDVPGARPGDVVSLGAPADLSASVVFSGVVVTDDTVEIRLFNTAVSGQPADASGTWYVTAGNGPHAGAPQMAATAAEAEPLWPSPSRPPPAGP